MTEKKQVEDLTLEDIKSVVYILIDTRFPKRVSLCKNVIFEGRGIGADLYTSFSTEEVLDFIKRISTKLQELQKPIIKDKNKGWVKYLVFWRIREDEFVIADRDGLPIHEISDLEPFEFIPSEMT